MLQKYVVFLHDRPIIFDENINSASFDNKLNVHLFEKETYSSLFEQFNADNSISSLHFICNSAGSSFNEFVSHFRFIKAAGGIVKNPFGKFLLIKRYDKWDLPKGKLEPDENPGDGAIREVMEETAVQELSIVRQLQSTFHIFKTRKGNVVLKETFWFQMATTSDAVLIPQLEEDITEAVWIESEKLAAYMADSYASLRYLLINEGFM